MCRKKKVEEKGRTYIETINELEEKKKKKYRKCKSISEIASKRCI